MGARRAPRYDLCLKEEGIVQVSAFVGEYIRVNVARWMELKVGARAVHDCV